MTRRSRMLCALALTAALSGPARADGDNAPSPDAVAQLTVRLTALAEREPALKSLLDEAVARTASSNATLLSFLSSIRYCDPMMSQYAAVQQRSDESIVFLARRLEEPVTQTDEAALRAFYAELAKGVLAGLKDPVWAFEPDLVVVRSRTSRRQICLRPGERLENSVDAVIHEIVHDVKIADAPRPDILSYRDLDDYAVRTVLEPGEEVDAYVFQFGVALRAEGRRAIGVSPLLANAFGPSGKLVGKREDLVPYVLEDLGYRRKRFEPEYERELHGQAERDANRRKILAELLDTRRKQVDELQAMSFERSHLLGRVMGLVWPAYARESQRVESLLKTARASHQRVTSELKRLDDRLSQIESRLTSRQR